MEKLSRFFFLFLLAFISCASSSDSDTSSYPLGKETAIKDSETYAIENGFEINAPIHSSVIYNIVAYNKLENKDLKGSVFIENTEYNLFSIILNK